MKKFIAAAFLILTAAVPVYAQQVIVQGAPSPVVVTAPVIVQQQPYCQPYSDKLTVGNEVRISRGMACLQPDSFWRLQPTTAGVNYVMRDGQVYISSPQPFVVVEKHHHHHH